MTEPGLQVARIEIFPIKSLDGVRVTESVVTAGGILENDRAYAMFDPDGALVNGKRSAEVHRLRATFDDGIEEVSLWHAGEPSRRSTFALRDPAPIGRWLTDILAFPVALRHDAVRGFPDDDQASGPTVCSRASLARVREWYPELSLESVRRRFRSNIELDGGEPFAEDALFGAPGELKPLRIGSVSLLGHNPCQRCAVPTRDPDTGAAIHGFQKSFSRFRAQSLPPWTDARRFDHYYRFAVNTSIPASEAGKRIRAGDVLAV
jgi:uncharacterized protein YcbX